MITVTHKLDWRLKILACFGSDNIKMPSRHVRDMVDQFCFVLKPPSLLDSFRRLGGWVGWWWWSLICDSWDSIQPSWSDLRLKSRKIDETAKLFLFSKQSGTFIYDFTTLKIKQTHLMLKKPNCHNLAQRGPTADVKIRQK